MNSIPDRFTNRARRLAKSGFTMMEIMLVVVIIVLLLGFAIKKLSPTLDIAKKVRVEADIEAFKTSLRTYEALNGFYPSTQQGLKALVAMPSGEPKPRSWGKIMDETSEDPYGQGKEYIYVQPGVHNPNTYDIFSVGPDHQANTEDDIGNWKKN